MLALDGIEDDTLAHALVVGFEEPPAAEPLNCEPPRLKVLVVEADASASVLIEQCLNHMPRYEPHIVSAGTLAAARFAVGADDFDIILFGDSEGMPADRGMELQVTLGSAQENCPILLLTASSLASWSTARSTGAAACLAKEDLSPKVLETVIHQALRAHAEQCTVTAIARGKAGA